MTSSSITVIDSSIVNSTSTWRTVRLAWLHAVVGHQGSRATCRVATGRLTSVERSIACMATALLGSSAARLLLLAACCWHLLLAEGSLCAVCGVQAVLLGRSASPNILLLLLLLVCGGQQCCVEAWQCCQPMLHGSTSVRKVPHKHCALQELTASEHSSNKSR
jgi:hypothetical protein